MPHGAFDDLIQRVRAAEPSGSTAKRRGFPTRESQANATVERSRAREAAGRRGKDIVLKPMTRKVSR